MRKRRPGLAVRFSDWGFWSPGTADKPKPSARQKRLGFEEIESERYNKTCLERPLSLQDGGGFSSLDSLSSCGRLSFVTHLQECMCFAG